MKHVENFWKCVFKFSGKSELKIDAVFTVGSHRCHNLKESISLCGI